MTTPSPKQLIENALASGCTDEQAAGFVGLTAVEYADLIATFLADDPDWKQRQMMRAHGMSAQAQINMRKSLLNNTDIADSKWFLERVIPEKFSAKHVLEVRPMNRPLEEKSTEELLEAAGYDALPYTAETTATSTSTSTPTPDTTFDPEVIAEETLKDFL